MAWFILARLLFTGAVVYSAFLLRPLGPELAGNLLFGVGLAFADIVTYYRTALKNRGELIYEEPPIHTFDTGRFREETMAFPPSVTVKDYTWGGSQGYLVPLAGGKSQRYPTIIQIVPAPPGERR